VSLTMFRLGLTPRLNASRGKRRVSMGLLIPAMKLPAEQPERLLRAYVVESTPLGHPPKEKNASAQRHIQEK